MKKITILGLILGLLLGFSGFISGTPATALANSYTASCVGLNSDLRYGSRSIPDISLLQSFLVERGYGSLTITGYFGPLTFQAVKKFQASQGILASGYVGPITRAKIKDITCGGVSTNVSISSVSPSSGPIGTQVTIFGSGFTQSSVFSPNSIFTKTGNTIYLDDFLAFQDVNSVDGRSITFTIPKEIQVCLQDSYCAYPHNPIILPGPLMIKVSNSNGTSNSVNFIVTSSSVNNQAPVINGVSAPTRLNVNQTGTWTVSASDPQNSQLTYSVNWGDSGTNCPPDRYSPCAQIAEGASANFQQSTSFTHSYSQPGTYTQTFIVRNSAGLQAQTTTTVQVIGSSSTNDLSISYISPTSGPTNTQVTLHGSGFTSSGNKINFSGGDYYSLSNLSSSDGSTLTFNIPSGTDYACFYSRPACAMPTQMTLTGDHTISVTNSNGTSNEVHFYVTSNNSAAY